MTAVWSDWNADVAIDVPGCPTFTIERAVKRSAIEFLERSLWLQRTTGTIDVPSGAGAQSFGAGVVSTGEYVVAVLKAWYQGTEIPVYGPGDVENEWPDWKTLTGTPTCLVMERTDGYYVVPAPTSTQTGALRLKVAIGLLDTATGCDDTLATTWRKAIADGAKAQLLFMPGQLWSDPQRADVYASSFADEIKGAAVRATRTPARRPLYTKPYFF